MKHIVLIGSISMCVLLIVLLYKLNKTKIEYDNKLTVLNRKVRDISNLIDLSNTKKELLEPSVSNIGVVTETNNTDSLNIATTSSSINVNIEDEFNNFVDKNENFFGDLDSNSLSNDIKEGINNLVAGNDADPKVDGLDAMAGNDADPKVEVEGLDAMAVNDVDPKVEVEGLDAMAGNIGEDLLLFKDTSNIVDEDIDTGIDDTISYQENIIDMTEIDMLNSSVIDGKVIDGKVIDGKVIDGKEIDLNQECEVVDTATLINEDNVDKLLDTGIVNNIYESSPNLEKADVSNNCLKNNLNEMSVKELQEVCRDNKLKIKGKKDELVQRIKSNLSVYSL